MNPIDEFVLNYTLERLEKKVDENYRDVESYKKQIQQTLESYNDRTIELENAKTTFDSTINSLIELVNRLENELKKTEYELNKTILTNIKQKIMILTLHNLQAFNAHDMYVDTFTDDKNIDWSKSTLTEWISDLQAIGKSFNSYVKVKQTIMGNRFLISGNGSSDDGIIQSFHIDKAQEIDRFSFYVEPHDKNSWRDLKVRLYDVLGGSPIAETTVLSKNIKSDWVDAVFPRTMLEEYKDYYVEITTDDPYGYRIGVDFTDTYLPGTSYSLYNGTYSDNNYDMAFKVWCYPASDEIEGYIYTKPKQLDFKPLSIIFEKEDVLMNGVINYHVSIDNGKTWKILQPGVETNLEDLPDGRELVIRATITGGCYINAWGYVIKRGDIS